MSKSSEYWKERFEQLEDESYKRTEKYIKDVETQFREAQNNITLDIERWYRRLADNNEISLFEARKLLKRDELEEFHWSVEEYIKKGQENSINEYWMKELENASAKVHIRRLEAMKFQMQQHAEILYTKYCNGLTDHLHTSYANHFYRSAYEIQKGVGVGSNLAQLDTRKINKVLTTPWAADGKNFSDRIWNNKERMVKELHRELTQSIIRADDPQKAINNLARILNTSKNNTGRLIMTEMAAVSSTAQKDCFDELDVEEFEIVATLDGRTSEICREMDGKHFPMSQYEIGVTAPPYHVRCRTVTVPYFKDDYGVVGQRAARGEDGKTYYVPADMTYKEWQDAFVKGDDKAKDRLGLITNNNKSNPRYYDFQGKSIDVVEQEISKNDYETAVCFGKNGKAIFAQVQEGEKHEVHFTRYQMKKMKGLDVTHSHPYSTPPSPNDLYDILVKGKPSSFRTCGNNGTYVLRYGDYIKNLPKYNIFDAEYDELLEIKKDKYVKMMNEGKITVFEAEILLQEEVWCILKEKYKIDYSFERR